MNQQNEFINKKDIKQIIKTYFYQQRQEILTVLKQYSENDYELNIIFKNLNNSFKNKFESQLKEIEQEFESKFENKLNEIGLRIKNDMDNLISDIHQKEPYNIIDREFRQKIINENECNFNILWFISFILVVTNAYLLVTITKL